MNILLLITMISISGFAAKASELGVTETQPACYGREYSTQHIVNTPKQTVKKMRIKVEQSPYDIENGSLFLLIEAEVITEKSEWEDAEGKTTFNMISKPYKTSMACGQLDPEKLECAIDCDGGSAKITWNLKTVGNEVLFHNNGFVLYGGCGEEDIDNSIWLDNVRGGDDVFKLYKLRSEFCQL